MESNYSKTVGIRFVAKDFVEDKEFKVVVGFWEHLGGFSGDLSFPLESVVSAKASDSLNLNSLGIRLSGTGPRGIAVLGYFRKKCTRIFCNWTKGQRVLTVE
jgi:hypothetical protein